jgi:hypothetical protein
MTTPVSASPGTGWFSEDDCRLDDFRSLVEQRTHLADYPWPTPSSGTSSSTAPPWQGRPPPPKAVAAGRPNSPAP